MPSACIGDVRQACGCLAVVLACMCACLCLCLCVCVCVLSFAWRFYFHIFAVVLLVRWAVALCGAVVVAVYRSGTREERVDTRRGRGEGSGAGAQQGVDTGMTPPPTPCVPVCMCLCSPPHSLFSAHMLHPSFRDQCVFSSLFLFSVSLCVWKGATCAPQLPQGSCTRLRIGR